MASVSNPARRLASQEDLHRIAEIIEANHASIHARAKEASSVVTRYFDGALRVVFELKEFPDFIIKLGSIDESLLKTIKKGESVVERLGLSRCRVPDVHLVTSSKGIQFWVEEKLDGIFAWQDAIAASEREFGLLEADPALRQKWDEIFTQAAQFIIEMGYYDTSDWRNILLMENGVGFIDFKQMFPRDREDIALGLNRLLETAPPESIDPAVEVIREKGYLDDLTKLLRRPIEELKSERKLTLELHARVRKVHETKTFCTLTERVDPSKYPHDSNEYKIIQNFNEHLSYKDKDANIGTDLLNIRTLVSSPYCDYSIPSAILRLPRGERKAKIEEFISPLKKTYEAALIRLKEDGVIVEWREAPPLNYQVGDVTRYEIFF